MNLSGSRRIRAHAQGSVTSLQQTQQKPSQNSQQSSSTQSKQQETSTEKVYIGQGRYVDDDPRKYPSKTHWTGGWAGGEAGLQTFVKRYQRGQARQAKPQQQQQDSRGSGVTIRKDKLDGEDLIYIGQGQYVRDDARKYPAKEDVSFMRGSTGGFLGGELGVAKFVDDGNVAVRDEGAANKRRAGKDAALVIGVIVLSGATALGLAKLGLVDLPLPASAPEAIPNAAASASANAGAAAADAAAKAAPPAAAQLSLPTELTPLQKQLLTGGGTSVGMLLALAALRSGVQAAAETVGGSAQKIAAQGLVLAAASAMGYYLLTQ